MSLFACVAIQEQSNQSNSSILGVVMEAQPVLLTVIEIPYVGKKLCSFIQVLLSSPSKKSNFQMTK
jgi:hypothetical protein